MTQAIPQNLRELELIFAQSPPDRIRFNMVMATSYAQRVSCVEEAIDWIAREHTKTRQHRYDRSEDGLTTDIITDLKAMGFDAAHDKDYGGHGDIVIEARDNFLWIGEAKIHSSYEWLLKGFQQLDTRYSTGLPDQENGGLIIYCTGQKVDLVMDKWAQYLKLHRPDVDISTIEGYPLLRRSEHKHASTGRIFRVRHVPISLYFDPKDQSKPKRKQSSGMTAKRTTRRKRA